MSTRSSFLRRGFAVLCLGALASACSVFGIRSGYEEAAHTVLVEDEPFEVRQYEDALIARTVTEGEYGEAGNAAFRRLGGYIFGDNVSQESIAMTTPEFQEPADPEAGESETIAMTTPVFQEQQTDGRWEQTFVLPSEYTLETLPVPTDPNVEITTLPGKRVAVVRFSGFRSMDKLEAQTERLRAWIAERGLTPTGDPRIAAYDPPWTLPFLRRNEIQIEVE